jgi:CHASE3 domain sensor protein
LKIRNPRALILSRPAVIAALAIAFALILATGMLTAFSTHAAARAERRAAQAQRSLGSAVQYLATLSDAAVATRRAIAVGDEKARATYFEARARHRSELAALRGEYDSQSGLGRMFAELQRLADERFAAFDRALGLSREAQHAAAVEVLNASDAAHSTDEIRRLIATLQRQEFDALSEESTLAAHRAAAIRQINLGLLVTALALGTAAGRWLVRRVRDLDNMVTVCAWTRRVQWQGKWISFEEYLINRFDLQCTHGICDEAAAKMKAEAARHTAAELRNWRNDRLHLAGHSTAPFA